MATVTAHVTLDSALNFTYGDTRLSDTDPLVIEAQSGVDVTIQLEAPISFEASHGDKGKTIAWKAVSVESGFARASTFPCPRTPFTVEVTAADPSSTAGTTTKTKKVRIEAKASGTAKGRDIIAAGHGGGHHGQ